MQIKPALVQMNSFVLWSRCSLCPGLHGQAEHVGAEGSCLNTIWLVVKMTTPFLPHCLLKLLGHKLFSVLEITICMPCTCTQLCSAALLLKKHREHIVISTKNQGQWYGLGSKREKGLGKKDST